MALLALLAVPKPLQSCRVSCEADSRKSRLCRSWMMTATCGIFALFCKTSEADSLLSQQIGVPVNHPDLHTHQC